MQIMTKKPLTADHHGQDSLNAFEAISSSELNRFLNSGATLITANQRLSRFRLQQYEQSQIASGKTAWDTPEILPWAIWLERQWHRSGQGRVLSLQQESLLWRDAILKDETTQVLNPKALSKQAMDAWTILSDYHIDPSCLQHAGEEHAALWRWAAELTGNTAHIFQHQMLGLLIEHTEISSDATIMLDGFDTLSPAQGNYLNQLQLSGCKVFTVKNSHPVAKSHVSIYQDEESELRQVCLRIRECLAKHPDYYIGVFIPNLEHRPAQVSRIFAEELAPALNLEPNPDLQGDYFNISLGSVLAKQPMIACAFAMLSLSLKATVQHHELTELLLNPYIPGSAEEIQQRAALDVELRRNNQFALSLEQLLKICATSTIKTPLFQQFITHMQALHQQRFFAGKQLLSQWVLLAENILQQLQWHEQATEPNEVAQVQNWRDLMQQLTGLDDFCGELSWHEALSRMVEHALEQPFRPAPGQANIQIMGLLEATNLRFDYAFVLGMDDITWPAAAKPNPLIPFDIQVLHQTPHANSEREWHYAQAIWQNVQHVSPTLAISYARSKGNQDVQASPLLQDSAFDEAKALPSYRYAQLLQQQPAAMEVIPETSVAVTAGEQVRGGTGLLKAQSGCAFQAFASYRLHLEGLATPTPGLNAAEQGTLLHTALENFWHKIKSHSQLSSLIEGELLATEVKHCIQTAWSGLKRVIPLEIKRLEETRLQQLMAQWLHYELEREPFEVRQTEVWRNIKLGNKRGLTLHTKIDRIDCDGHGHHIILDYKTGSTSATKALGLRPDEPQLPAYLLAEKASNSDADAVAFAQVRIHDPAFKGFAQEADILPELPAFKGKADQPQNWAELTLHWQEVLDRLADEFMAGEAGVSPKSRQSCNYCDFEGFCQISRSQEPI